MLKLLGVKSEASYRAKAAQRAADKRKARKDLIAANKRLGVREAKEQVRKERVRQPRKAQEASISAVAEALCWEQRISGLKRRGCHRAPVKRLSTYAQSDHLAHSSCLSPIDRKSVV